MRSPHLIAVLLLAGAGSSSSFAQAPGLPDPKHGLEIATKLCTGCHRVTPGATGGNPDVPSFMEIAGRPGRDAQRIVNSILLPHPQMPDISLSTQEMQDIAAYIVQLKNP